MQPLNAVTLRDCGQVPHCEKFSEPFSGRSIYSLMDLFSFYDRIPIDVRDRDFTAMNTFVGFIRLTCLPQGWTNSVAFAQQAATTILEDVISEVYEVYIDDIAATPNNVKDIQSCLGSVKHYRSLIYSFSKIAEPLTRLTRKDEKFIWKQMVRLYKDSIVVDIDKDIDFLVGFFKVDLNSDKVVVSHLQFDLDTVDED
ncbi:hypothetical protein O9G_005484 [Rozella allomycis CSF55]|uniref:Reverse transcriptase domain-containing protein n=1 Tax=Rozella allomycis (strain CSF55) TaxID=988480 RepID=A0A075AVA3_ROZAC|nr:hypothetical protein O9G_005484 [Rozella allomycis CSF55]|eukprot:EPZ32617.1 hypothetical protein O9G_005484 [Rozella allomycis CSF55]